jgi:hypothetical protein
LDEFREGDEAKDVAACIQMLILFEATIMVVGRPCVKSEVFLLKKSITGMKDAIVVSAITLCNGTNGELGSSLMHCNCPLMTSILISPAVLCVP